MQKCTILDGPLGTELEARGYALLSEAWSAKAVMEVPELVAQIHASYAVSGATVHTANTFRTQPRLFPTTYSQLTRRAVELARDAVPTEHRIFGSVAPLRDCYRPELARVDADARRGHQLMIDALVAADVDGILCETFANPDEAMLVSELAVASGRETWLSLTPGPSGDLLSRANLVRVGMSAKRSGVNALLVNCCPLAFVDGVLSELGDLGVRVGVYANAYSVSPDAYAAAAAGWIEAGASIVGVCCGGGAEHVRALAMR